MKQWLFNFIKSFFARICFGILLFERRIFSVEKKTDYQRLGYPGSSEISPVRLVSSLPTVDALESDAFRYWNKQLQNPFLYHRKFWEYAYVCQALYEREMLKPGKRGLGFAVGKEPLPAYFASKGCFVVATDLASADKRSEEWKQGNQWGLDLSLLNSQGLCDDRLFLKHVTLRPLDMNFIPGDMIDFDFTWSCCSFEHCGSIDLGKKFLLAQMRCLKPGGVAVHTTEFNLTSNLMTLTKGPSVLYRRRDMEDVMGLLSKEGYSVEPLDLSIGDRSLDKYVDAFPYSLDRHMRLNIGLWAATSIGLIIKKQ